MSNQPSKPYTHHAKRSPSPQCASPPPVPPRFSHCSCTALPLGKVFLSAGVRMRMSLPSRKRYFSVRTRLKGLSTLLQAQQLARSFSELPKGEERRPVLPTECPPFFPFLVCSCFGVSSALPVSNAVCVVHMRGVA